MLKLREHQVKALKNIRNGSVLCGGVGSGKSMTSIAYYYMKQGGTIEPFTVMRKPKDLYIITTARKRDTLEWEGELTNFLLSTKSDVNYYDNKVVVDSWNNLHKYVGIEDSFFIFDEQRVVGTGTWVKSFLKIAKVNDWILLSATPGDTWTDYIPLFLANGFYKNVTEFRRDHVIYSRFSKFPKIDKFVNTRKLTRLRDLLLVTMDFERHTEQHHYNIYVDYDAMLYKKVHKDRWNIYKDEPIINAAELCYTLRRVVNSDISRQEALLSLVLKNPKSIIFYNFDYELELIKSVLNNHISDVRYAEWNGHKHQEIPTGDRWVYLVQYTAGCEGWNCISTDTIIFYSQNYSYKVLIQAAGRTDRLNTKYTDLHYYHLKSRSNIDLAIARAISQKKKFNEGGFVG